MTSNNYTPEVHSKIATEVLKSLVGSSLVQLKELAIELSIINDTILIFGETGTGKETVARAIAGARSPFVVVNCAAITETLAESELFGHVKGSFTGAIKDHRGFFEQAVGGAIFLDEINSLSSSVQAKLLRVLETRKVRPVGSEKELDVKDIKIIAASNNLELDTTPSFRLDLYWRLAAYTVTIPPLRIRKGDLEEYLKRYKIPDEDIQWIHDQFSNGIKGNYREVNAVIKRYALLKKLNHI